MPSIQRLIRLSALLLLVTSVPGFAQNADKDDGNELLRECNFVFRPRNDLSVDDIEASRMCMGYLEGYRDAELMHQVLGTPTLFCMSPEITNGQMLRVVIKGLEEHPERLHLRMGGLVFEILKKAFPCSK